MSVLPLPIEDLEHVLKHTRALWEQLRGQRLFVTGATGFFGAWLLESFAYANDTLHLGAELVALSRHPGLFQEKMPHLASHPAIHFHQGDVRDFKFPEGTFSHVIHAGTTSSAPVPPLEMMDTIVRGTRHTLEFAIAAEVKRFLFISSGAVYGTQVLGSAPMEESCTTAPDSMNPTSAYGEGKRVAELLCSLYHQKYQLETTVARCFAFVGPHLPLNAHFALGNFLQAALEKRPIVMNSTGASERSYLYAADLAIWLWTILFQGQSCRPYNVGSEQGLTIYELAQKMHQTLQLQEPIQSGSSKISSSYIPNTMRAQEELSLKEHFTIQESIQKHFNWLTKASQQ